MDNKLQYLLNEIYFASVQEVAALTFKTTELKIRISEYKKMAQHKAIAVDNLQVAKSQKEILHENETNVNYHKYDKIINKATDIFKESEIGLRRKHTSPQIQKTINEPVQISPKIEINKPAEPQPLTDAERLNRLRLMHNKALQDFDKLKAKIARKQFNLYNSVPPAEPNLDSLECAETKNPESITLKSMIGVSKEIQRQLNSGQADTQTLEAFALCHWFATGRSLSFWE